MHALPIIIQYSNDLGTEPQLYHHNRLDFSVSRRLSLNTPVTAIRTGLPRAGRAHAPPHFSPHSVSSHHHCVNTCFRIAFPRILLVAGIARCTKRKTSWLRPTLTFSPPSLPTVRPAWDIWLKATRDRHDCRRLIYYSLVILVLPLPPTIYYSWYFHCTLVTRRYFSSHPAGVLFYFHLVVSSITPHLPLPCSRTVSWSS